MKIGFWNVRGILDPLRRAEVRRFVVSNDLCFVGLLETKVPQDLFDSISANLMRGWVWLANYEFSPRGRIWIGWNPSLVSYSALSSSDQALHGIINVISSGTFCYVSAVYGEHSFSRRRSLWEDLCYHGHTLRNSPWLVAGDFNAILDPSDRTGCSTNWISCFNDFPRCITRSELMDLRYVGCRFTWSTSSGQAKKMRKIDRVLVNGEWNVRFSYSEAKFLNPGISDHSPMTVRVLHPPNRTKPFKFFEFWTHHPDFKTSVNRAWSTHITGVPMFCLVYKLKRVKLLLKSLNRDAFSDISSKVAEARHALADAQFKLQANPASPTLTHEERECHRVFLELRSHEESFYRQKSRIKWLKEGDKNTKFFHQSMKRRHLLNRILSVKDASGNIISDPLLVPQVFVDYFSDLLSPKEGLLRPSLEEVQRYVRKPLSQDQVVLLGLPVTDAEIKSTLFSLAKGKAPGPDGFPAEFYKHCWDSVGSSVLQSVHDFFRHGLLLKEVNATILALVPKVPNASAVTDYRPIACCNTIYKLITKILANRIAGVLPNLIDQSQNAFVKGRRMSDNILLAQELFASFHLLPYLPKCAIKVDFHKAYDTVDWDFLELVLQAFRFPSHFIKLIMACVRSPSFSISVNGDLHGFFPGGRGVRQGDPMSPYLFTLVMEVFSGILTSSTANPDFRFYWRCKPIQLSHLFFADDVFLFCQADWRSAAMLKKGLDRFSSWSGLLPNKSKSEIFLAGGDSSLRNKILWAFGFQEGNLPVRYLGVPIISSRLKRVDCMALTDRITARIQSWTHRFLSFAGRLQLIRSVLHSIQAFWSSVFTLPASVLEDVDRIIRQFLWKGTSLGRGGAKVAWQDVCCPKCEGGLGIRNIKLSNRAFMVKYIWILFSDKQSLWCRWIHSVFLKKRNFWIVDRPGTCSWMWKKILQLRPYFRSSFRWVVGNGYSTSLWYDYWLPCGPLDGFLPLSFRESIGLPDFAVVADLYSPIGELLRSLMDRWSIALPTLSSVQDKFTWCHDPSGQYSVASAWEFIRPRRSTIHWANLVWDNALAPRYQFILWLISKGRLPTQVLLLSYGRIDHGLCAFCNDVPDSVDHLFFGCRILAPLASFWATRCNVPWKNRTWKELLSWAPKFFSGKDFYHKMVRFSFGALCHLIWKKRNAAIFRGEDVAIPALKNHLIKAVRDKAISFATVPSSPRNLRLQRCWGFDPGIFSCPSPSGHPPCL